MASPSESLVVNLQNYSPTFLPQSTLEGVVGQFQRFVSHILCVQDGTTLTFHRDETSLPRGLRFELKQRRNGVTEYFFREMSSDNLYCFFGRAAATLAFPSLRYEEPDPQEEDVIISKVVEEKESP